MVTNEVTHPSDRVFLTSGVFRVFGDDLPKNITKCCDGQSTNKLERELQVVQPSATKCSCIANL